GRKPIEQREIVYPNKFLEFMCKNNKKNTKRILIAILVFLLLFFAFIIGSFINEKLDKINDSSEVFTGVADEDYSENFDEAQFNAMHEISNAASLDDLLKKWHNNGGELMKQKYIINVLLVGIDGKNGVTKGGNSDSLILVSINKKTEKITLVSFMRDSRSYFEINGKDYWSKVNAAYARGGASATVKTLENDYKVDIDYYVAVDFSTFPKVINALGGITVDVKQYEQEYINRTTHAIKKIPNYGKVKLDGAQALVYSRIRHSDADSDVSRTRRQRTVIEALIKSAKGATKGQLLNAVDKLLPYLGTDCPKNKIVAYAAQALTQGWMDYEITNVTMPDEECRKDAMIDHQSLWVVDYPLAAQKVQLALYGKSNIELSANRVSAFSFVRSNSGYSSSSGGSSSSDNKETTTYATTKANATTPNESETTRKSIFRLPTTTAPAEEYNDSDNGVEETPTQAAEE
ncbi:MAG TPA: hypothetical protein DDY98_01220, partial [Ruminococcaceae bacterium]|nr:hypothetical protein [Oscillospiraceae bacterium]